MNTKVASRAFVSVPGEGEQLGIVGKLKVSTAQAGGAFEAIEIDASMGPMAHVHHDREECFYIIEGQYTFMLGDEEKQAPAGSVVFVPRGTSHSFKPGPGARSLVFSIPGGLLEGFFREISSAIQAGRPEAEVRRALAGKYDTWPVT